MISIQIIHRKKLLQQHWRERLRLKYCFTLEKILENSNLRSVLRSKFNIPRVSFHYLA